MILYWVEIRRALARRVVRALAALAVLNFIVAGIIVFVVTDSDAEVEQKLGSSATFEQDCLDGEVLPPGQEYATADFGEFPVEQIPKQFRSTAPEIGTDERGFFCEEQALYLENRQDIRRFDIVTLRDVVEGLTPFLTMVALFLGASLIGAEWHSGMVGTLLTWEPRRVLVYLSKAAAAITIGATFFVFAQLLLTGALWPSAMLHGSTLAAPGFWGDLLGTMGRATAAAAITAGMGFAIASATRSTVFALAMLFLVSILDGIVTAVIWRGYQRWSLFQNMAGFVEGTGISESRDPFRDTLVPGRSAGSAGLVIAMYLAVLLAAGTASFRARDVN